MPSMTFHRSTCHGQDTSDPAPITVVNRSLAYKYRPRLFVFPDIEVAPATEGAYPSQALQAASESLQFGASARAYSTLDGLTVQPSVSIPWLAA